MLTSTVYIDARWGNVVDGDQEEEDYCTGLEPARLLRLGQHFVL